MGLKGIWNKEGNYLIKGKKKGWHADSTGCSCCSTELTTVKEIKPEIVDSLTEILIACDYLNINFNTMIKRAKLSKKYRFYEGEIQHK